MGAPEWPKLAPYNKTIYDNIGEFEIVMTTLVYLDFFEIDSTLLKEFHEIVEVLHAWLVMTTIAQDGLIKTIHQIKMRTRQKLSMESYHLLLLAEKKGSTESTVAN